MLQPALLFGIPGEAPSHREKAIVQATAAVYTFDPTSKGWKSTDGGVSQVYIYEHEINKTFRVVAISAKTPGLIPINSAIFKDITYQKASSMFHEWADASSTYGLNFASQAEADSFASAFSSVLERLKTATAQPTIPAPITTTTASTFQHSTSAPGIASAHPAHHAHTLRHAPTMGSVGPVPQLGNMMAELALRQHSHPTAEHADASAQPPAPTQLPATTTAQPPTAVTGTPGAKAPAPAPSPRAPASSETQSVTPRSRSSSNADLHSPRKPSAATLRRNSLSSLPPDPDAPLKQITSEDVKTVSHIGSCAFTRVSHGHWNGCVVAVKKLQLEKFTPEVQTEFVREATAMWQCKHPNIARLYAYCVEQSHHALVMEWFPRGSLFDWLHSAEEMPWAFRLQLAVDVVSGLAYLHSQGILHCNLKSQNIMIDEHKHAKLCDFGQTRARLETAVSGSAPASSIRWYAPELFTRRAHASWASDIYALGMILWEIASRKIPYAEATNENIVIEWIKTAQLEDMPQGCPPELAEVIKMCWNHAPESRPDAETILEKLRALHHKLAAAH